MLNVQQGVPEVLKAQGRTAVNPGLLRTPILRSGEVLRASRVWQAARRPLFLSLHPLLHRQLQVWVQLPFFPQPTPPSHPPRARQRHLQEALLRQLLSDGRKMQILPQPQGLPLRAQHPGEVQVLERGLPLLAR